MKALVFWTLLLAVGVLFVLPILLVLGLAWVSIVMPSSSLMR